MTLETLARFTAHLRRFQHDSRTARQGYPRFTSHVCRFQHGCRIFFSSSISQTIFSDGNKNSENIVKYLFVFKNVIMQVNIIYLTFYQVNAPPPGFVTICIAKNANNPFTQINHKADIKYPFIWELRRRRLCATYIVINVDDVCVYHNTDLKRPYCFRAVAVIDGIPSWTFSEENYQIFVIKINVQTLKKINRYKTKAY